MIGYLEGLDRLLSLGAAGLSKGFVDLQVGFVAAHQLPDGGFRGRQGGSDPYYTDFALRVLALLAPDHDAIARAASYLDGLAEPPRSVVECFSVLNAARLSGRTVVPSPEPVVPSPEPVIASPEPVILSVRREGSPPRAALHSGPNRGSLASEAQDGAVGSGYQSGVPLHAGCGAPGPVWPALTDAVRHRPVSPYDAFLAALCLEILEQEDPSLDAAARALSELCAPDGGFRGTPGEGPGQTSLTAAAVGLLQMREMLDEETAAAAAGFLAGMQAPDGGLRAHARAPGGDLLSTFTGMLTLFGLDAMDALDLPAVARFARASASPAGGFCAAPDDEEPDVEYTYYGLGTVCLLRAFALLREQT